MFSRRPRGAISFSDKKTSGFASLLWMLVGAVVTIAAGTVIYKTDLFNIDGTDEDLSAIQSVNKPTVQPKEDATNDNQNYQFYDILPEQEMTSIPETTDTPDIIEENIIRETQNFKPDMVVQDETEISPPTAETSTSATSNTQVHASNDSSNTEKVKQATVADTSSQTSKTTTNSNPNIKATTGDEDMVIVYENSTYEGEKTVTKTITKQSTETKPAVNSQKQKTTVAQAKSTTKNTDPVNTSVKNTQVVSNNTDKTKNATSSAETAQSRQEIQKDTVVDKVSSKSENLTVTETTTMTPSQQTKENSKKPAVTPSVATDTSKSSKQADQNKQGKNYMLQINSFNNADEADKRRAQVMMAGIDAQVVKNRDDLYQVVSNSMTTPASVVRAQQKLQKNGIESIIIEKR